MLQEDLLDFAGDDGGVQLAGQGRHLVQAGAGCEGDSQAERVFTVRVYLSMWLEMLEV